MILDAESCLYLTNKKLYQLCKLIDHLDFQIAQQNYEAETLRKNFAKSLDELEDNYQKKVSKKFFGELIERVIKETDQKYQQKLKTNQENFMNEVISLKTDTAESEMDIKSNIKKVLSMIQQVKQQLRDNMNVFNNLIAQNQKNIHDMVEKAQLQHSDKIKLHDEEQEKQVHNLEVETKEKLAHLDEDFNESVAHLKKSFLANNNKNLINRIKNFKGDLEFLLEGAQNSKRNVEDYTNLYKINLQKAKNQIGHLIKSIPPANDSHIKSQIDSEQAQHEKNVRDLRSKQENSLKIFENERSKLDSQLKTMNSSRPTSPPPENSQQMKQKFKDELIQLNDDQENDVKTVEDSIIHLTKIIAELREEIVVHRKRLIIEQNKHKDEREQEIKSHLKKIDLENKKYQSRYADLVEALALLKDSMDDQRKIEETQKLRDVLKKELEYVKKEAAGLPAEEFEKNVGQYLNYQIDLANSDFSDFEKQEQVYINVLAQTYKNGYENKYNRLQEEIENEKTQVEQEYVVLPSQKENIDLQLRRKYEKYNKDLESIEVPAKYMEYLKKFEQERNAMIEEAKSRISKEKEKLISEMQQELADEENRHMNYLSGMSLFPGNYNTEEIRISAAKVRENLNARIEKLNNELIDARNYSVRDAIAEVIKFYDDEELRLNREIAELNKECHNRIVAAQNARKSQIAEMQNTILNERKKNHSDQNKYRKSQKTEDLQAMNDELQRKLDMITGNISNLWIKEKERNKVVIDNKVKEFLQLQKKLSEEKLQRTLELEKLINESNSEINDVTNKYMQKFDNVCDSYDENLAKLKDKLEIKRKRFSEIKEEYEAQRDNIMNLCNTKESRIEEISRIDRLDNQLKMLEGHKRQLLKDFKLIKEQLIMNDDAITSRFGGAPNVSILRAASALQQVARPFTATPGMRRPIKRQ